MLSQLSSFPQDTLIALSDSLQTTIDSTAIDSLASNTSFLVSNLASKTDSTDVITQLGRDVGEAGVLLVAGEWEMVIQQLYQGIAGLVISFIPKFISAFFVLILFYGVYRALGSILKRVLGNAKRFDAGLRDLIIKIYRVVMRFFIAVMVLDQFGVDVSALLAGLSIIGLAVGLAARDSLENFIAGLTVLLDKPFSVGDYIMVDDVYGRVDDITLRSTRIKTQNHQVMVMPNLQMVNQKIINHSLLNIVRLDVPFGIAYKENPDEARNVVLALTKDDNRFHENWPAGVVVTQLNDSSVDMSLRLFLVNPKDELDVLYEYTEKIKNALVKANIEIPFPHLQLAIDEAKGFNDFPLLTGKNN